MPMEVSFHIVDNCVEAAFTGSFRMGEMRPKIEMLERLCGENRTGHVILNFLSLESMFGENFIDNESRRMLFADLLTGVFGSMKDAKVALIVPDEIFNNFAVFLLNQRGIPARRVRDNAEAFIWFKDGGAHP